MSVAVELFSTSILGNPVTRSRHDRYVTVLTAYNVRSLQKFDLTASRFPLCAMTWRLMKPQKSDGETRCVSVALILSHTIH